FFQHFKRTSKVWKETWSILLNIHLVKLAASSLKEYLIGISDRGELYQYMLTMSTPTFERVQNYGSSFTHVCMIKPQCEMLATLGSNGILDVWDKTTGGHVGAMSLEAKYLCMVSSPKLPYIVLGRCDGVVDFLNVYCPERPQVLCQVSLCAWEIQDVQFTLSGSLLVAANTTNGDFFLIKANAGDRMEVLSYTSCKQEVTDFTVLESKKGLHLLVLVSSQKCCKAGLKIIVYEKLGDERILSLKGYVELAGYYIGLSFHPEINLRFFGVLHRSKQIHVLEFTPESAGVATSTPCTHQPPPSLAYTLWPESIKASSLSLNITTNERQTPPLPSPSHKPYSQ
ncbi:unnamed protein product, partial [Timema podura]|nr:unnamed protein product [Timema podura]